MPISGFNVRQNIGEKILGRLPKQILSVDSTLTNIIVFQYSDADVRPNASEVYLQFKNAMVGAFKILTHFNICLISPGLNEGKKK